MPHPSRFEAGGRAAPRPFRFARRRRILSLSPFRPFHLWKGRHFAPLAGILIGLVIFLLSLTRPAAVFEWRTLDMRFQDRGSHPIRSDLAVVFIGDDAIQAFGRWPWSWDYHALLVDILARHGAKAVVFDVLFAEAPVPEGPGVFPLAVKSAGNVYLSSYFSRQDPNPIVGLPPIGAELTEPIVPLRDAARGLGHCNATPDADGITRRIPLLIRYSDGYYPSIALQVTLDTLGVPLKSLNVEPGKWISVPVPGKEPLRIPLDDEGQTLVNFSGGLDTFEQYSFLQVLQSDQFPNRAMVDLERLRGKTVLVGVIFAGNTDIRPTPLSTAFPLLCVLGNAMDNILQGEFIHRSSFFFRILLCALLGALTAFISYALRPLASLTACVLLTWGYTSLTFWRFGTDRLWLDLMAPLAVILANYLVMTTIQYVQTRREKMNYLEYLKYMDDLVESSTDAIVSFDEQGIVGTWNRGAEKIFGWSEREALGKGWELLVPPGSRERVGAALRLVREEGKPQSLEVTGVRKGGGEFPAGMNLSRVQDSQGTTVGISCISQDLTEKMKMVELLVQSEKMAELGRLGSGIVHEIKNPLTSIMMLSGMVLGMKNLEPKASKYIAIIDQEAQRILRLSQNILSFARPKKPEMKAIELNRIIEETLSLVEYELKKNKVELILELCEGGVTAVGDDEKLKQVFLNLIINSVHAMEGGGRLTIATGPVGGEEEPAPEGYRRHTFGTLEGERGARVVISDEGSGIPPQILDKIFEPFFSTKGEGKGTGLGLYITRNIILEHRGRLTVSSKAGSGTRFCIVLPVAAPASGDPPVAAQAAAPAAPLSGPAA